VEDYIPFDRDETIYNDTMSSRKEAIRMAQKYFSRQPINNCVSDVWAAVYAATIGPTGTRTNKRIYNLYKNNK